MRQLAGRARDSCHADLWIELLQLRRGDEREAVAGGVRGICRACCRLGPEELAHRSAVRNIERAMRYGLTIPRRQREFVERFLTHPDPRVRAYATEVVAVDREQRAAFRRVLREDEEALLEVGPPGDIDPRDPIDAEDIPF
jgi:hypothetical protein